MKNIISIILIISCLPVMSQQVISVDAGVAAVSKIDLEGVKSENKGDLIFGVNYTYFLNPVLAIDTGLGLSNYSVEITPFNNVIRSNEVDSFGSGFELRTTASNYIEKQELLMLTLPLKIRYESASDQGFYAATGVKFMLPVSQNSNVTANSITTKGYYPDNNLLVEDIPAHGFTTQNNVNTEVESLYTYGVALSAELGIKLSTGNYHCYFGAFVDYGLTDMRKKENRSNSLIKYGDAKTIKLNSISTLKSVSSAKLLSFGLQWRFPLYTIK